MKYPEHAKLKAVARESQAVGRFFDWLADTKGIALAVQHEHTDSCRDDDGYIHCGYRSGEYVPARATMRGLLAEFFEIDEEKLEREKSQMLAEIREAEG